MKKLLVTSIAISIISIIFPIKASACTYESTITGNHLDLNITSDVDKIQVVQLMHKNNLSNAPYVITALQGPANFPWVQYLDSKQTYRGYSMIIQNRRQTADGAYWVNWIDANHFLVIPAGIYGVDFTGTMTVLDISVWYRTMDSDTQWFICDRTGDVSTTPSTVPKITIIKHVENNDGGNKSAEDFTINIDGENQTHATIEGSENGIEVELAEGGYEISEDVYEGYEASYSSDCSGTITNEENKTCTITNEDVAPTVTLIKEITNDPGEIDIDDFQMSINGNIVSSGLANKVRANEDLVVNENSFENYEFVSITGDRCPESLGESFSLQLGQDVVCIVTNNYISPKVPITKVIIAPGLGASWNLEAFINCKKSTNQGSWSLAPYAESVYSKILQALESSSWEVKPFYYDWRQNVTENARLLTNFVNQNTSGEEKVNFVGHSMGGLVGRSYIEANNGGKFAKYFSVGTPHQGSTLAYAPWAGGEVWTDNLIEDIAINLYLKHCGGAFSNNRATIQSQVPSIQNLLPTMPYLRDARPGSLKPISSMSVKNNLLPTDFAAQFGNVDVGTLSGVGQKTLNIIKVVNPSRSDIRLGNWIDGVPNGKEYTNEGDGTVLTASSRLEGANNQEISQTHRGLVGSADGIDKILNFLGLPDAFTLSRNKAAQETKSANYTDDKSALILIGYPSNFQITDGNGNVLTSVNGMITIMNPKSEDFELQFESNNVQVTFIVAQYLTNGQTFYKEYKFKTSSEPKIIEFDSKHPKENILYKAKEYDKPHIKTPHFSKFWFSFWNFWKKHWSWRK